MFYIIVISGVFLDLISKNYALNNFEEKIKIFGDFLYLKQIYNPGIAFGIEIPTFLLKSGTFLLIIGIFLYYRVELKGEKELKNKNILNISFGLIISGALGNAYERIFNEKVIDFIGVKYFSIFNLADSFITIGATILIYYYYKKGVSDQEK
ncbi:MAG: signal peptidase II [Candidatus Gracilibacteria bacterium]|nr:signal peptidase II [Candidatus Gracilibacteria bacterium]